MTKKSKRACGECHQAKGKCEFSAVGQRKCDRCLKANKDCVPHVSRQGQRPKKDEDDRKPAAAARKEVAAKKKKPAAAARKEVVPAVPAPTSSAVTSGFCAPSAGHFGSNQALMMGMMQGPSSNVLGSGANIPGQSANFNLLASSLNSTAPSVPSRSFAPAAAQTLHNFNVAQNQARSFNQSSLPPALGTAASLNPGTDASNHDPHNIVMLLNQWGHATNNTASTSSTSAASAQQAAALLALVHNNGLGSQAGTRPTSTLSAAAVANNDQAAQAAALLSLVQNRGLNNARTTSTPAVPSNDQAAHAAVLLSLAQNNGSNASGAPADSAFGLVSNSGLGSRMTPASTAPAPLSFGNIHPPAAASAANPNVNQLLGGLVQHVQNHLQPGNQGRVQQVVHENPQQNWQRLQIQQLLERHQLGQQGGTQFPGQRAEQRREPSLLNQEQPGIQQRPSSSNSGAAVSGGNMPGQDASQILGLGAQATGQAGRQPPHRLKHTSSGSTSGTQEESRLKKKKKAHLLRAMGISHSGVENGVGKESRLLRAMGISHSGVENGVGKESKKRSRDDKSSSPEAKKSYRNMASSPNDSSLSSSHQEAEEAPAPNQKPEAKEAPVPQPQEAEEASAPNQEPEAKEAPAPPQQEAEEASAPNQQPEVSSSQGRNNSTPSFGTQFLRFLKDDSSTVSFGSSPKNHFGLQCLIREWITQALSRRSFDLLSRTGDLAHEFGIDMDVILAGVDLDSNMANRKTGGRMNWLLSMLLEPRSSRAQPVDERQMLMPNLPATILPLVTPRPCTSFRDINLKNRWVMMQENHRGNTQFYCSPSFEKNVMCWTHMSQIYEDNLADIFSLIFAEGQLHKIIKVLAHQVSLRHDENTISSSHSPIVKIRLLGRSWGETEHGGVIVTEEMLGESALDYVETLDLDMMLISYQMMDKHLYYLEFFSHQATQIVDSADDSFPPTYKDVMGQLSRF